MSGWHYQVFKQTYKGTREVTYHIGEYIVFDEPHNKGWTEVPVAAHGSTVKQLERDLEMMLVDLRKYGIRSQKTGKILKR